MPLPNLEKVVPIFTVTVPSTGEEIQCRPFLVKEEKILLIALASDEKSMHEAVAQTVASCVISPIKADQLSNFDLEYIFLQLRAESVNEIVELSYRCHNEIVLEPEEIQKRMASVRFKAQVEALPEGAPILCICNTLVGIRLNLRVVHVKTNPGHSKVVQLTDTVGMTMKYPNLVVSRMLNQAVKGEGVASNIADTIKTVAMCVESVFDAENVYTNFQVKEMIEWVEKLTQPQFNKILEFFETMPKLAHDVAFFCPKCSYSQPIHLEGLESFFG